MTDSATACKSPHNELLEYACRNRGLLHHIFDSYTHNYWDAQDLFQDLLQRLLQMDAKPKKVESPGRYLWTLARNMAIDWQRHKEVVKIKYVADDAMEADKSEICLTHPSTMDLEHQLELTSELAHVLQQIDQLPLRCRTVFILRRVRGHTQREIATILGISENTVEQHLFHGVRALTTLLSGSA